MFLLPAFCAGSSDIAVLYLRCHPTSKDSTTRRMLLLNGSGGGDDDGDDDGGWLKIESTMYLACLSLLRLALLVPLFYHTYTGTRVKCSPLYHILNILSMVVVVGHTISIVVLDPGSLQSFLPDVSSNLLVLDGPGPIEEPEWDDNDDGNDDHLLAVRWNEEESIEAGKWQAQFFSNPAESSSYDDDPWGIRRRLEENLIPSPSSSISLSRILSSAAVVRHVWLMLALSLFSIVCHFIILMHVRSTAPSANDNNFKGDSRKAARSRRMLAYYAYDRYRRHDGQRRDSEPSLNEMNNPIQPPQPYNTDDNDNENEREALIQNKPLNDETSSMSLLLPNQHQDNFDSDTQNGFQNGNDQQNGNQSNDEGNYRRQHWSRLSIGDRSNSFNYDEFLSEIQSRLTESRKLWSAKLEDVTNRMRIQLHQSSHSLQRNVSGSGRSSSPSKLHQNLLLQHFPLTPFRALLQLYAQKEVFQNRVLDRAFGSNDTIDAVTGQPLHSVAHNTNNNDADLALALYAPQILTFLLHGAFFNSPQLEQWVLKKCRLNIHFAHRCFWFLRSWCLGHGPHKPTSKPSLFDDGHNSSSTFLKRRSSFSTFEAARSSSASDSSSDLFSMPTSTKQPAEQTTVFPYHNLSLNNRSNAPSSINDDDDQTLVAGVHRKVNSSGGLLETSALDADIEQSQQVPDDTTPDGCKYPSEEHALIESLLFKVIDCGAVAATALHYQHVLQEEEVRHDTERKHTDNDDTLSPTNDRCDQLSPKSQQTNELTILNDLAFEQQEQQNSPTHVRPIAPERDVNLFLSTPRFLDALLNISDDLLTLPKSSQRTPELRRRLALLEKDFLPSNVICMPVNNVNHRVLRIVDGESIALSTKERVPCIITLEVIDFHEAGDVSDNVSERPPIYSNVINDSRSPQQTNRRFTSGSFTVAEAASKFWTQHKHNPSKSEWYVLNSWYKKSRPPQRHNTLLEKVSTFTQMGLRKIAHDIEDTLANASNASGQRIADGTWRDIDSAEDAEESSKFPLRSVTSHDSYNYDLEEPDQSPTEGTELAPRSNSRNGHNGHDLSRPVPFTSNLSSTSHSSGGLMRPSPSRPLVAPSAISISSRGTYPTTNPSPSASLTSSRANSRPQSPATVMGQWSSTGSETADDHQDGVKSRTILRQRLTEKIISGELESETERDNHHTEEKGGMVSSSRKGHDNSNEPLQYGSTRRDEKIAAHDDLGLHGAVPVAPQADDHSQRQISKGHSSRKRPPPVVFKEDWASKENRLRSKSSYGTNPNWRLLPILIKSNDDLRQEQLASQLIHCMASILARARVPVWLYPYEIIALTDRGGIVEAIPDTISIDSLKRNDPHFVDLSDFFERHFGPPGCDDHANAKANFVESLAAYSMVCYIMQIKDRHNGNILLTNKGHLIHIDFGFFFLSSPGKNSGFESAPFKLTRDFVNLMDGPQSRTFAKFRDLCFKTFLELRKHCYQITLLVEMLMEGNEELPCFRGNPEEAVRGLRERFRLDLNDRACVEYVNSLVDESLENWRTRWYDRYQRFCVGVL